MRRTYSISGFARKASILPLTNSLHLRRLERAKLLDREADNQLCLGRHTLAERLANEAAELREVSL